ncbi:MAG TPA: DUF5683 domain-containing protein [Ferruginibacter sp.]|nr:DUF5683 domain-containing protein [Ferruginibacter sp.]
MPKVFTILIIAALFFCNDSFGQKKDSALKKNTRIFGKTDTSKIYNPRIAIVRSAIIPGWGQATNKKYWKIPVVYAALGVTGVIFFRNIKQYREARDAYINATDLDPSNDFLIPQPYFTVKDQPERIRTFRNQVRQNVDYTVLFFIAFWGLNVVDAAVDAHLKTFDVSDDLSLHIKAGYSPMANTNGVSLVLNIGKNRSK